MFEILRSLKPFVYPFAFYHYDHPWLSQSTAFLRVFA